MARKHLSVIIIPHQRGRQRIVSLSKRSLKWITGLTAVLFITLIVFLVDYSLMNGVRKKHREMSAIKAQQDETLARYEASIGELNEKLETFEKYRKKLNVMAGLKSEEALVQEPGVGGAGSDQEFELPSSHDVNLNRLDTINLKAEGIENNLDTLSRFFENQMLELAATPSIAPTKGYWASPYGWRDDPFTGKRTFHTGVDIATHYGNPIVATADGLVIATEADKTGGKTIKISHTNSGYMTIYCHLSKYLVKQGQRIKRGDAIGLVGKTGRAIGPHVHYEVRLNDKSLNPWYYILDN